MSQDACRHGSTAPQLPAQTEGAIAKLGLPKPVQVGMSRPSSRSSRAHGRTLQMGTISTEKVYL